MMVGVSQIMAYNKLLTSAIHTYIYIVLAHGALLAFSQIQRCVAFYFLFDSIIDYGGFKRWPLSFVIYRGEI